MGGITYVEGDATRPASSGPRVIAHVCNDRGGWGRGFVLALSRRWKEPERDYRAWYASRDDAAEPRFELGAVRFVPVEDDLHVANLIGQAGTRSRGGVPPVRYEAIETALEQVAKFAATKGASVHMPRIGCGLAGGTWDRVEPIVERTLVAADVEVVVYDLP